MNAMDLVIQSQSLSAEAVEAFRVALLAPRHRRHADAARFYAVPADRDTHRVVQALAAYWQCDIAFVHPGLSCADVRVLVMDMDSTAITVEGIDELARLAGKGEEVAAITGAAMRGEIADYAESLRRRVALLAGADVALLDRVRSASLQPSAGARRLCRRRAAWAGRRCSSPAVSRSSPRPWAATWDSTRPAPTS